MPPCFGAPIHAAWPRYKNLQDIYILASLRLARRVPRHPKAKNLEPTNWKVKYTTL